MSDLLGIGASGVRAYQSALTTVSENIANTATPGYARRATDLREVGGASGVNSGRTVVDAQGVVVAGITRSADPFRAAEVRTAGADLARSETGIAWLDRIETALTGNKLGDRLTGFFTAATRIAADPTATTPRAALLEAATSVAGAFSATGKALDGLAAGLDSTGDTAAASLTGLGAALARVNDGLGRALSGSSDAAQLADRRDALLEQISALSDVSVATDSAGRATVRLGNAAGPVFVAGNESGAVTFARGSDGTVAFALQTRDGINALSPTGGALAGLVDGAQRIADARRRLDGIAGAFRDGVNAAQAGGRDLDGNAGAALFASGASPSDLSSTLTDPRGIAAAAIGGGPRDNANLRAFDGIRTGGGFEDKATALVAGNGATLAGRRQVAEAQSAIRDGAIAARDAVGGVNLDSEAVDLLRFQQAYQASSRVIQVARETLQTILDIR